MDVHIGEGITVGVKKTLDAPKGIKVESFGVKLVPGGVAFGMQTIDKDNVRTDYAATIDARSAMEVMATLSMYARKLIKL